MSSEHDDGHRSVRSDRVVNPYELGSAFSMTLRDYFAAKAMQAFIHVSIEDHDLENPDIFARCAYIMADKMLSERARNRETK